MTLSGSPSHLQFKRLQLWAQFKSHLALTLLAKWKRINLFLPLQMNNIISWNARGIGNRNTSQHLNELLVFHKADVILIMEPKVDALNSQALADEYGLPLFLHGEPANNHMWIMGSAHVLFEDVIWSSHQVTFSVIFIATFLKFVCTFVHAPCDTASRQDLWNEVADLSHNIALPWLVIRDFNAIASWDEKSSGNRDNNNSLIAFNDFQLRCGLSDAGFIGNSFTGLITSKI